MISTVTILSPVDEAALDAVFDQLIDAEVDEMRRYRE